MPQSLLSKISDKTALVGVVGLGYVGLPLAVEKAKAGFTVIGIEQDPLRVNKVNQGTSYIEDVRSEHLNALVTTGMLTATSNQKILANLDVIVVTVPTPLTKSLTPDLQHVISVVEQIALHLRKGQLLCLESTTYPGTTDEVVLPMLSRSGLKPDVDFFVVHSPERVDPGNKIFNTQNTTKLVGGIGPNSNLVGTSFYAQTIKQVVGVSNSKTAEFTKLFENTFRAVNIALVNEMTILCDRLNISVWEVLDSAFTKQFGIMPFYPGPGVGGHCIPLDPHYLEWRARQFNFPTHFITLAGEINRKMPSFVLEKVRRILNKKGKAPSVSKVLVLGVSYKRDVSDYRESPAVSVMRLLKEDGVTVTYHDPFVPCLNGEFDSLEGIAELTAEKLASSDLALILTDHSQIDYQAVVTASQAVLDTRNATRGVVAGREKIELL